MRVRSIVLAATFVLATLVDPAPTLAAGPEDSVNGFHEALLGTMKEGRTLGESGRYAQIQPVVQRVFDIPSMIAGVPRLRELLRDHRGGKFQSSYVCACFLGE